MFYKQRINAIADKVIDMDTDIKALKNAESELLTKVKAIIECINGDRKDINAIINIIKKLQTKGKK